MNQSRVDILVGIFVLAGMISLGYLAISLGKLEVMGTSGYVVYGDFASVAGLKVGDPVEIAGVNWPGRWAGPPGFPAQPRYRASGGRDRIRKIEGPHWR